MSHVFLSLVALLNSCWRILYRLVHGLFFLRHYLHDLIVSSSKGFDYTLHLSSRLYRRGEYFHS